jgi:hypothetical protein
MDRRFLFPIITLGMGVGCYTPPEAFVKSYLYPVRGPLTAQKPIPVIVVDVEGAFIGNQVFRTSGSIIFSLPDGESFQGQWSRDPYINGDARSLALLRETDIATVWDAVFGEGFYVANVMGAVGHARAKITGSKGTIIQVEFGGGLVSPHIGVALDGKGNIFKLALP